VSVAERLRELADRCVARNAMTVESSIYVKDLASEVEALEESHEWAVEAQNHNADQAVKLQKMLTETEARLAEAEVQP